MSADITPYLDLVPTQNRAQPNFIAVLTAILQPIADTSQTIASLPLKFDIDLAVGVQEDVVGQWVGQSRNIPTPLAGVYFSFDIADVGFDQGAWQGADDPTNGLSVLPDEDYRTLLKAKVGANYWDGTPPEANRIWDSLFADKGIKVLTFDNDNMTMTIGIIIDQPLNAVTRALFENGYLQLRPAGVGITGYYVVSAVDAPFFGFDAETGAVGGFDVGAWAQRVGPRLGVDFFLGSSTLS